MRGLFLASTFLVAVMASSAMAQQGASPTTQFMSDKQIMALIDKAKADRKGDAPNTVEPILTLGPYKAQLEYRVATAPAAVHEKDAEMMIVLQGVGNIRTGGKLVDEKRNNANNLSGASISDGTDHNVVKGDSIFIPPNTPHQVLLPGGGAPIVLMTMHVPYPPANWPPTN
jgi:mannose-6-phosphate isomerase-like protein (cupin superfamily)